MAGYDQHYRRAYDAWAQPEALSQETGITAGPKCPEAYHVQNGELLLQRARKQLQKSKNIGRHTSMLHSHSLLYQLAIQSLSTRAMPFALACNVAQTRISPICTCGGLHHRSPQASMSSLICLTSPDKAAHVAANARAFMETNIWRCFNANILALQCADFRVRTQRTS